ncbi:MAG: PE-PGRS family protein [Deltaproteobacteria bacterium]|nr:PE-PGRS family protein [Deltaproteobacteria bacterium]
MRSLRFALALTLVSASAHARVVQVATPAELTAAITAAVAGDEIVLADGTYVLTGATCSAVGTAAMPIVVRAANAKAAKIEFNGAEGFKVTGAYWTFDGLDIKGVCAADSTCEHAFHVSGAAHHFVLRNSRVMDFNAQLKANASMIGAGYVTPNNGLIENNEIADTRARNTSNPVTKLNIDTGEDWVIRSNYIHDFEKQQNDYVSYGAFFKSGSKRGIMERNLVICSTASTSGYRIGLSLGGGGTAPQFCAPAYNAGTPCSIEHTGGIIRNNIVVNCSDVGIYLNKATDSHLLYNTLIETTGIDFRYAASTGEAVGNVLSSIIRNREGGTSTQTANVENVILGMFQMWYRMPLTGDLHVTGGVGTLIGQGPSDPLVTDDYCGRPRPAGALTIGALEHSLGSCETTNPTTDAGVGGDAGTDPGESSEGCGCRTSGGAGALIPFSVVALALGVRRRRRR